MFHFLLVANILEKVRFKTNYHASRLRFLFFRFLNDPLRCLDQRYRFK